MHGLSVFDKVGFSTLTQQKTRRFSQPLDTVTKVLPYGDIPEN